MIIESPRNGNTANVDSDGRLQTLAHALPFSLSQSIAGEAFSINTGAINITSDNESWILYIKNTDTISWVVESTILIAGASTGGSGEQFFLIGINHTSGTLLESTDAITPINLSVGNQKQLSSTVLRGSSDSTSTGGGSVQLLVTEPPVIRPILTDLITMPPGTSLSLGVKPPTGNTAMLASMSMNVYRLEGLDDAN